MGGQSGAGSIPGGWSTSRTRYNDVFTSDAGLQCQDHCDFSSLQSLLWAYKTQDLIDTTHTGHYERFRSDKLLGGASQVCSEASRANNKKWRKTQNGTAFY